MTQCIADICPEQEEASFSPSALTDQAQGLLELHELLAVALFQELTRDTNMLGVCLAAAT